MDEVPETFEKVITTRDLRPKKKPERMNAGNSYERSQAVALRAKILAKYSCELDPGHKTFPSTNGTQYMETHHVIPMSMQDLFEYSLDIDANVACLCPTCHRMLHYGVGEERDNCIRKLLNNRKDDLEKSGIAYCESDVLLAYGKMQKSS